MDIHCELSQFVNIYGFAVFAFRFTNKAAFFRLKNDVKFRIGILKWFGMETHYA